MKAIVVTDHAAGAAGMKLMERPKPQAAINDVVVQIHASGFTGDELTWPSTSRRRHREAVCGPDSRRRNAGDRHRPDRGAALWRPDYRLRRRTRLRPIEGPRPAGPGWSAADKHRQSGCPRRCRRRLQPDRTDQGKDDHPRSSVRTRGLANAHEGAIHALKIFTTLSTGMMMHSSTISAARHSLRALLPVGRIQSFSIGDTRWCCRFVRRNANASCARLVAPTFTQYSADSRNLVGATPAGESPSRNIDVAIGHARQTRGPWHEVRTN